MTTYRESHIDPLLGLSARIHGHPQFDDQLTQALNRVTDWKRVINLANHHALTPLLAHHCQRLKIEIPKEVNFAFKNFLLRQRAASHAQVTVLQEVLQRFEAEQIPTIILKGGALAHQLYPTPAHRPMADIDIWIDPAEIERAFQLLAQIRFTESPDAEQLDNKSYPEVRRRYHQTDVNIELHHHLFGSHNDRHLNFQACYKNGHPFNIGKTTALSLNRSDQLWHLYRHAISPNIRYPQHFRLDRIADLVTAVEQWLYQIDWPYVQHHYPEVCHILPLLHWLTPWSTEVIDQLKFKLDKPPQRIGELYTGYPSRYFDELLAEGVWPLIKQTGFPSPWWIQLHYGRPYWQSFTQHTLWLGQDLAQEGVALLRGKIKIVR